MLSLEDLNKEQLKVQCIFFLHFFTDLHRENLKKKRRELEQASLDAASDLLDTDSNATFAMVF